jgi:hypothetical protein
VTQCHSNFIDKINQLRSLRLFVAIAAGWAAATLNSPAQGIQASATLTGVAGTGNTYDYTLVLSDAATATTSIEGFWYAWIPGHFFLPSAPSSASGGTSGWTATPDGDSIQFQGNAGDAIAPGSSATFTFVTADSPTVLAGTSGGFPIGDSVAYPGTINFSGGSPNQEFAVQSVPEPSSWALLGGGLLSLVAAGRRGVSPPTNRRAN